MLEWIWHLIFGGQGFPCLFHLMTGFYCPGCGGTRAVRYLLQGQWQKSLAYHPIVLYTAAVLTAEGISWCLAKVCKKPGLYLARYHWFLLIGFVILMGNWIYKNYMLIIRGIDLLP